MAEEIKPTATYNEDNIVHLDDREHIRRRPGMYIGKLGDGSHSDDGIYVLIKETIDNCIDEFRMNEGKVVEDRYGFHHFTQRNTTTVVTHANALRVVF